MSGILRNPFVHLGKTAQDLTSLVDVVPQGLPMFDTANTMEIFQSMTGKLILLRKNLRLSGQRPYNWNVSF